MTSHVCRTPEDMERLSRLLASRKLPITVSIASGALRTAEQNKLQRKWAAEASEQLGDRTPEDVRAWCKLHIGVPIMREGNAEFREKYDRIIKPLPYSVKLECMAEPIDFPVTRQMTMKQKTEYLDGVFKALSEQGVILTMPDGSV